MLGSLRLVDPKAAGAQTLRLVIALVVSAGVTGAVTGPLAYRAVEFRAALAQEVAAAEAAPLPSPDRAVLSGSADNAADNAAADAGSLSAPVSSDISPGSPSSSVGSGAIVVQQAAEDPATDGAAAGPASSTTAGENGVSPATISRPPAVTAIAPTEAGTTTSVAPVTPPSGTTTPAGVTTTTRNPLDEFNPRPSCDDKAQELNAEDRLACAARPPGG